MGNTCNLPSRLHRRLGGGLGARPKASRCPFVFKRIWVGEGLIRPRDGKSAKFGQKLSMHCRPGAGSGEAKGSRANREMVSSDVAQNTTDNPTCIMRDAVKFLGGRSLGYKGRGV